MDESIYREMRQIVILAAEMKRLLILCREQKLPLELAKKIDTVLQKSDDLE
jgi:hypothetical protein